MARLRALSADQQMKVADMLGKFISEGEKTFGAGEAKLALRENFPVLSLRPEVVGTDDADLSAFLEETGTELHQVSSNGRPIGYSISHATEAGTPVIDQYTRSADATSISAAIAHIDALDISDAYEASVVDIRAMNLGVIVLVDDDGGPTLVAPFRVPSNQDELLEGAVYSSTEFRSALRKLRLGGGFVSDAS